MPFQPKRPIDRLQQLLKLPPHSLATTQLYLYLYLYLYLSFYLFVYTYIYIIYMYTHTHCAILPPTSQKS